LPIKTLVLFVTLLISTTSIAEEKNDEPDLAFFEFLGSFETTDGRWLDPMEIENMLEKTKSSEKNETEKGTNDE